MPCSANNEQISAAQVIFPRAGVWTADIIASNNTPGSLSTGQAVTLRFGQLTMTGHVRRGGVFLDGQHARIVGGNGGLALIAKPFVMQQTTFKTILTQLLSNCGERLSPDIDPALLAMRQSGWTVVNKPTGPQLSAIVNGLPGPGAESFTTVGSFYAPPTVVTPAGAVWRFNPDGTVLIVVDAYPAATLQDTTLTNEHPERAEIDLGPAEPQLLPGISLNGRPVSDIAYTLNESGYHMKVWFNGG